MDGVLLIDKPIGPTSHDVVARIRNVLRVRSVGHTGTLDPMASGLLPLVVGQATRLASLLTGADKTYETTIRLGMATDTHDGMGRPVGDVVATLPSDRELSDALEAFRGRFAQLPPSHSAKRVAGAKAYELARQQRDVTLTPVEVEVKQLDWLDRDGDRLSLRLCVTAGFYVRALARDLGHRLGCGAHLTALRRTASGSFSLLQAVSLADAERRDAESLRPHLISPTDALPGLALVRLTQAGHVRASHGNLLGPGHLAEGRLPETAGETTWVRILAPDGHLAALGRIRGDFLHPAVVLG